MIQLASLIELVGLGAFRGASQLLASSDSKLPSSLTAARNDGNLGRALFPGFDYVPFERGISSVWAYNLALAFIIPKSCPLELALQKLPRLEILKISPATRTSFRMIELEWDPQQGSLNRLRGKRLLVGWVGQARRPVYTFLSIEGQCRGIARVPNSMEGIILAIITTQPYETLERLTIATLAGPVVVIIS